MATIRKYLWVTALNVGAPLAALGMFTVVGNVAWAGELPFPRTEPYLYALAAAALAVVVLRLPSVKDAVLAIAARRSLAWAIPMLGLNLFVWMGATYRPATYVYAMRGDLRQLAALEARIQSDSGHFTADVGKDFIPSAGVTISPIRVSDSGWSATATHRSTWRRCAIYVGPRPEPPAQQPGVPGCAGVPVGHTLRGVAVGVAFVALGLALATAGAWVGKRPT